MVFKEVVIRAINSKHVAVIGGGFFGVMTAIKLAERGFKVTIFERKADILYEASYINQNRMHMGYHYPRSFETAMSSFIFQKAFCNMFREAVVEDFDHYYCVAKKGSMLSSKEYIKF